VDALDGALRRYIKNSILFISRCAFEVRGIVADRGSDGDEATSPPMKTYTFYDLHAFAERLRADRRRHLELMRDRVASWQHR
jgi:hypothetical protein